MKMKSLLFLLCTTACMMMAALSASAQNLSPSKQSLSSPVLQSSGTSVTVPTPDREEDTFLLSFVLMQQYRQEDSEWKRGFVVQKETLPLRDIQYRTDFSEMRRKHTQTEEKEAFDDFARRNKKEALTPPLHFDKPLQPASRREIDAALKKNWWKGFYRKYPNTDGYLALSLPGYSKDHNTALVYVSRRSGGISGDGELFLLIRKEAAWIIKARLSRWQS